MVILMIIHLIRSFIPNLMTLTIPNYLAIKTCLHKKLEYFIKDLIRDSRKNFVNRETGILV